MRAIVIERWTILRYGLRAVLGQAGHPVLSTASTAEQGLEAVRSAHALDLVIVGRTDDQVLAEVIATLLSGVEAGRTDLFAPFADRAGLLTARETDTLSLLSTGASNREIARRLFVGESTVKSHLVSIYAKLGVANRHQAVARSLELGLLPVRGGTTMGRAT